VIRPIVGRTPESQKGEIVDSFQIAQAIINDRATMAARRAALNLFISGTDYFQVVQRLLPLVSAELKKPGYEGMGSFADMLWPAAAEVLEDEIARAIDSLTLALNDAQAKREGSSC